MSEFQAMYQGLHLVDKALEPAPEPESVPIFRKIDEVSLKAVELVADEICAECGQSATAQCNICPLDTLFARIG
jgi:hypothetical protein